MHRDSISFLCVKLWSKWHVSHGNVPDEGDVTIVFMMIKLDGKATNGSFKLKGPKAYALVTMSLYYSLNSLEMFVKRRHP